MPGGVETEAGEQAAGAQYEALAPVKRRQRPEGHSGPRKGEEGKQLEQESWSSSEWPANSGYLLLSKPA